MLYAVPSVSLQTAMRCALRTALLATAAAGAAGSSPCSFSLWRWSNPAAGTASSCEVLELSALPSTVYRMNDSFPDNYLVTAPCNDVVTPSGAVCNSSAVQGPSSSCGLPLGALALNSTAPLPNGEDGMRITMQGGVGGRALVYDMICDKTLPVTAGPTGLVGTRKFTSKSSSSFGFQSISTGCL